MRNFTQTHWLILATFILTLCAGNLSAIEVSISNDTLYYDSGGKDGNYSNSEQDTITFIPEDGRFIAINFLSFALETCCDYMRIYDGPNTDSALIGSYTEFPGRIVAENETGALTIVFHSDGSVTSIGWEAVVSSTIFAFNFSANPIFSRTAPYTVEFSYDLFSETLPTTVAWDFNGDSIIDSNDPNPTITFTEEGIFDVSLTLMGSADTSTIIKKDYLHIGTYTLTSDDVVMLNGEIIYCSYDFSITDIVIPARLDGQWVTKISSELFQNKGITSVELPHSLVEIDDQAFYQNKIEILDVSQCSSLEIIGSRAFQYNSISTVAFENLTSLKIIESYGFASNQIELLNLSNCADLQQIDYLAFYVNELDSVNLTGCTQLSLIGRDIFYNNNNLGSIILPIPDISISETGEWYSLEGDVYLGGSEISSFSSALSVQAPVEPEAILPIIVSESQLFTDSGGDNNYTNSENDEYIFVPENEGDSVTVKFLEFATESCCDRLYVYDSIVPHADALIGTYRGDDSIGTIKATNADGALSFLFHSDGSVVRSGWKALVYTNDSLFCDFSADVRYSDEAPLQVTFTDTSYAETPTSWSWDFDGDGNEDATGQNPGAYTYSQNGIYNVSLTVSNGIDTNTTLKERYIVVGPYTLESDDVEVLDGEITELSRRIPHVNIIIPSILDDQTITRFGNSCFKSLGLTKVVLPESLVSIGDGAFEYNELETIDLNQCPQLEYIGSLSFYGNTIKNIDITGHSSIEEIGGSAFSNNSIDTLNLDGCSSLKVIQGYSFYSNDLDLVNISNCSGLIMIGSQAFNSNNLSEVVLPTPENEGLVFDNWRDNNDSIYAGGEAISDFIPLYFIDQTVISYELIFKHYDGSDLSTQIIEHGLSAEAPDEPQREGFVFVGWDTDFNEVESDLVVTAQFRSETSGIKESFSEGIVIYPNPATDQITIEDAMNKSIVLYSLSGKILVNTIATSNMEVVSVSELATGMYILSVGTRNTKVSIVR